MFALLAVALALTGCIEFDRQTMTYEHDAQADTLRIHQTYHGIYGADDVTQLSGKEREQLADVMKGQRTFFFANWIFELNVGAFKESLASEAIPKTNSLEEALRRAETNLLTLLVANVRVENGKFYLDDKGRPCGTQRVTIRNVSKLIAAGNELTRRDLEVKLKRGETAEERELINAALARPEPFFTLTGQQIRYRGPLSRAEFDQLGADDPKLKHFISEFIRQGGTMAHENGEVRLRFGRTDAKRETVTLPMASKENYRPNAAAHLRETHGLTKDFDPKQDAEAFFKTAPKPAWK
jgi:hypothetical protein